MGYLFALTCLLNVGWIATWLNYEILWSFVCNIGLWATLAWIYYQLAVSKTRPLYTIPISLYLGWIAVSIIAHFNVLLIDMEYAFMGMDQENWTIILVSITIIGGLLMHYWNRDIVFNLVLIWALLGTYSKHYQLSNEMVFTLIAGVFVLGLVTVLVGWRKVYLIK